MVSPRAEALQHPGAAIGPFLLLLVAEQPAHGYVLRERVEKLGLTVTSVYREIGKLEAAGFVVSAWDDAHGPGPPKRVYAITEAGEMELRELANAAWQLTVLMENFIRRWAAVAR